MYRLIARGAFSSLLTLSAMLQCLAILLLTLQVLCHRSAAGISVRALCMDGMAFAFRLSSTVWLNGYLPADVTGDWIYQTIDMCSLGMTLFLIHHVLTTRVTTYNKEQDTLPCLSLIAGAFVLAAVLHADLDNRPFFDIMWMTGLFTGTVAVLPQLWMITHKGGHVDALTSHYVAVMAMSRVLSGIFMWHAWRDVTCKAWVGNFNHAAWAILGAHGLHLLLMGDFAFYYVKAVAKEGIQCCLEIADALEIV